MTPPFVKKFDFRGVYNKDITDADGYYLGLALARTINLQKVLIGWDTRESSKTLAHNFINALKGKDIEISYMDKCPIDYVTAAANAFDFDLSVMFTGSHNPWNWTGLLMHTKGGDSVQGEKVAQIVENYYIASQESYSPVQINLSDFHDFYSQIEEKYSEKIKSLIPLDQVTKLKVLVDLGDGSGSRSLSLLEKLLPQVTFVRINDRGIYDGSSSHTADPSQVINMKDLIVGLKTSHDASRYDGGFAFDSDADRVLAIDEKGNYLNGSLLGSSIVESFIRFGAKGTIFGYAVDCGPSMYNTVISMNKVTGMSVKPVPVGRSIMRKMIRDGELDFAVENVGHFYSKEFFMTDSGIFSLALILYWISLNGPLSMLEKKYSDGIREQIFVPVQPVEKEHRTSLYEKINKFYEGKRKEKKIDVDGIRYEFFEGDTIISWYAIRKSGYEQVEKFYFGSLNEDEFSFLKKIFEEVLEHNASLVQNLP